ncbi:glycosyltransferase family 2 protein [Salipiger sp. H15]|uniref:Glycosyltransferase family 2 protein n=1 Tax=Alloyangia sp. H15 TaxID=3029062 RepID=A0AAU8AL04_9RHOB
MHGAPPTHHQHRRSGPGPGLGRPLCALLVEEGALDPAQALEALARSQSQGSALTRLLIAEGRARPEAIRDALARSHGVPSLSRQDLAPAPALAGLLPPATCLRHCVLPLMRRDNRLSLALARPEALAELRALLPTGEPEPEIAFATEEDIFAELAARHGAELAATAETALPDDLSCRDLNRLTPRRALALVLLATTLLGLLLTAPALLFSGALAVAAATLALGQIAKLAAFVAGLRPLPAPPSELRQTPSFSLLIPLHREENIAATLVRRLGRLEYPRAQLEALLVLEADDARTRATLEATALPPWMRIVEVPGGSVTTKPRALNYALDFARGAYIGIYDAEDSPAPDQLRRLAAHFSRAPPDLGCVQGILDHYNAHANWLSRCFTIEYASWFRILLPGFARLGFAVPLGGTTAFFPREVLDRVGRWDAFNVTEDADLGIRLARFGYRTELLPLVTREEANCEVWPWVRQRSRWLKGYLVTWLVHMRSPRRLLRELGPWRFFGFQVIFLTGLLQFLLAPLLWSFWLILLGLPHPLSGPETPALLRATAPLLIGAEAVSLLIGLGGVLRSPHPGLLPWVPTLFLYFPLATVALYKALWEMLSRPFYWDKTSHGRSPPDHVGADLPPDGT